MLDVREIDVVVRSKQDYTSPVATPPALGNPVGEFGVLVVDAAIASGTPLHLLDHDGVDRSAHRQIRAEESPRYGISRIV